MFNFCPSVSAITGISPQRYVWRIGVALHSTPRLLLASVYYSHYVRKEKFVKDESKSLYQSLINFNYWFHVTEIMALVGVTYISNKENYRKYALLNSWPMHVDFCMMIIAWEKHFRCTAAFWKLSAHGKIISFEICALISLEKLPCSGKSEIVNVIWCNHS